MDGALWSDPATWPNGRVPSEGDAVTIDRDTEVVLDVSPPPLRSLTINGKLSFANDNDIELITDWIMLHGELHVGSEAEPHTRNATITLVDNVPGENINAMGDRGVMVMGGTLSLHGDRVNTWTKLAKTAEAGSTSIEVLDASGWRVGDEIVLASTDFDPRQAEKRTISAINGNVITLDRELEYMHFGAITFDVDERGEVGLLTRNIRIQASDDAESTYQGGHVMAMPGSTMQVSGVELYRMGQHLQLARYPIHWHLVGDAQGQFIRNSAIHNTYSRCVTVHGTNNLRIENNVTFNNVGHCFFLEDGIETGNQFVRNLGIMTKCHPTLPCVPTNLRAAGESGGGSNGQSSDQVLIPSDNTASTFWITNPSNDYVDNVAAGSDQIGFWLAVPEHPTGEFEGTEISANTWPRRMPLGQFRGNVAHSTFDGIMFDRGPRPDGTFTVAGGNAHIARENPADGSSPSVESVIEDFTGYKNRNGAIWSRGEMKVFRNLKLADNAMGFTHASGSLGRDPFTSLVVDSLFVGETDNIGNPRTPEEIAYGRSLPKTEIPDFPIRGYEFYDYRHDVENVTFVNFEDNATREAGAISYLLYTSFGISAGNVVEGAKFINAKPVHFPTMERRWGNDNGGSSGYRGAIFHDRDGSVGGVPDSYIVIDNGIASDEEACEIKPSWNAAVCQGDFGRVSVGGGGGGGGFGGFGGFGGPGGAAGPAAAPARGGAAPAAAANRGEAAGPGAAARPGAAGPGAAARPGAAGPGAAAGRGGAPGAGAPAGAGGGFGGFGGGAAADPVILSRNGREFEYGGETTIRSGAEVRVDTARESVSLSLRDMDNGSWVIFELPGFTTATAGVEQSSLAALRDARDTSYYKDGDTLWVKLVVANTGGEGGPGPFGPRTSIDVSK
jgi:cell migration-inducing and hyaluronan-binding protein